MELLDTSAMMVFARVVEAGGFSAAARQLGLSKSAVSKQVSRLENTLGARLLNRTTRSISLTESGEIFYAGCQQMIEAAEAAQTAVSGLAAQPSGRLRVSAPMSFGVRHLAPRLTGFFQQYPAITLDLDLGDRTVDLVEEGFDLAIRIGELQDSSLIARRLGPSRQVLCAAPRYLERAGVPRHPDDLKQHCCLLYSYGRVADRWRFRGEEGDRRIKVQGPLRVNNGEVIAQAAVDGFGIAALPTFISGEYLQSGELVPLLEDWSLAGTAAIYALYPAPRLLSPKIRVFIDYLVEAFGAGPYWDQPR